MAVRHQLIRHAPATVWSVLADPSLYGEWVVGTSRSEPLDGPWPEVGSRLRYTVRLGPSSAEGTTTVRHQELGRELELEAAFGKIGTARIFLQLRPWGEETLVICDEHPLRGPARHLHTALSEAALQLRHRSMLARLAEVVDHRRERERGTAGRA
ncbi:SRPBCC family protein [Streptomyces roseofulvus]|uniref:SRPBCC family protein n=2 Tax=Streptomyces TaxID=1883 RepID=A0ABU4KGN9_9ACTN|nr:SRPBCC family protein [Streptomyces roseolus]MDX2296892.1 SRPBCC family protein [Streptomyces roseolus]